MDTQKMDILELFSQAETDFIEKNILDEKMQSSFSSMKKTLDIQLANHRSLKFAKKLEQHALFYSLLNFQAHIEYLLISIFRQNIFDLSKEIAVKYSEMIRFNRLKILKKIFDLYVLVIDTFSTIVGNYKDQISTLMH
jgi:hypothetical protein